MPANGGVYAYGTGGFPTLNYKATNYWIDVVLHTVPPVVDSTPPEVVACSPAANSTDVAVNALPSVTFSEPVDPTSITAGTVKLFDAGTNLVPTTFAYNPNTMTVTLTPGAPLAYSNTYTIVVTGGPLGVKDVAGNLFQQTMGSTFTTVTAPAPDTSPPTVVAVNPTNGQTNVAPGSVFTVTFSEGLNAAMLDINRVLLLKNATNRVTASVSYNAATNTVSITPASPLDYATNYTIYILGGMTGVQDLNGNAMTADLVSAFTTAALPVTSSLWPTSTTPGTVDVGEAAAVNLGVKFTANTNGLITGLRFYKSAANTGTHIGQLWSSSGQLLATATFTNETASGWQQVTFSSPVAITAGTTYVASYFAPNGHFAVNRTAFKSAFTSGPLSVPANGGVFQYASATTFPSQSYQASNYWVDVLLATTPSADTTPPTVTSTNPANGATNIAIGASATVTFSEAVDPATISNSTVMILDGNSMVTATVVYNSGTHSVTVTPTTALANSKTYTISVVGGFQGVKDLAGNPLSQTNFSTFSTMAAAPVDTTPPTVTSITPANGATNVATAANMTVTFSEALNAATVSTSTIRLLDGGTQIAAGVTYNSTNKTVTITPAAALSNSKIYTISILGGTSGVQDVAGNALAQTVTSTFTTAAATATPPSSLWSNSTTPGTVDVGEAAAVNLGVKFTANTNGLITGLRFYKSAANTGVHTASLWSSSGQLLATATFTSETASGWQQVTFSSPVAITAGTTYVASYFTPNGHFAVNRNAFTKALTSGHLSVPANGGVFQYSSATAFPNQSYQASNYWVDVLFVPAGS